MYAFVASIPSSYRSTTGVTGAECNGLSVTIRRRVESWDLNEIDAPNGTRDPVVLHSDPEGRAVMIRIHPGQELGIHQVKERAWICVVEGRISIEANGRSVDARPGTLATFAPNERHAVRSDDGARILLLLAPWPGEGHYRGGGEPRR
jgi:quercetin dioxygenase-like cupin family protein